MLAVESAVVVVERVPDPAYCFRRREGSVERQPADGADQSEQLYAGVAVGLLRWEVVDTAGSPPVEVPSRVCSTRRDRSIYE